MKNPDERKAIAKRGQEKIERYYTYEIQLKKMFEIINKNEITQVNKN